MGAVCLVHQTLHSMAVCQCNNAPQVGTDAVVGGVVDQHRFGIGILLDGFFYLGQLHSKRDAQTFITFGVDIYRNGTAQYHGAHHTAVDVAGQDDFFSALCDRKYHRLYGRGGAAHHQKGMGGAKGVGSQLLGFSNDRNRMAQIIQRLHRVDIDADTALAQQLNQLRVAASSLVPGNIEGNDPHFFEVLQSLIDGRSILFELVHDKNLLCGESRLQAIFLCKNVSRYCAR